MNRIPDVAGELHAWRKDKEDNHGAGSHALEESALSASRLPTNFRSAECHRNALSVFARMIKCSAPPTGRSGGYTSRLCCHSVRPGQAGDMGREEPDEDEQGQVQGPVPGEEQPHAPVQVRG